MRSCVPLASSCGCAFLLNTCMLASALSPPPRPHSAARMVSVLCTCHSLIYPCSCRWETCSDAHPCDPSSVSTVALGCLARVYFLSLTSLPLLLLPTCAPPYSGAQINALRAQPDTQPDAKHPRHQGETPRSHSCRAPFLSHHACASLLQSCSCSACFSAPPRRGASRVGERRPTWRVLSWPPG